VSILVHPDESAVLAGYGSMWYFPARDCVTFDNVADATAYAKGRGGWNHSGLVYSLADYLTGKEPAANLWGVDPGTVRPRMWSDQVQVEQSVAPVAQQATTVVSTATLATVSACPEGIRKDQPPSDHPWFLGGDDIYIIANVWTNQPGHDQTERKLLLKPGEVVAYLGGGSSWSWPEGCTEVVQSEFDKNPLAAVTLVQLEAEGLLQ